MMRDPKIAFMLPTSDKIYGMNKLYFKRFPFVLVEPNPVTFYYSVAFDSANQLEDARSELKAIIKGNLAPRIKRGELSVAYSYVFKVTSVSIIFSFLALEAFLNQQLPDYNLIQYKGKSLPKEEIQRYVPFLDKLNIIIPSLEKKDFGVKYPNKLKTIIYLKKLRDDLMHLKHNRGNGLTYYDNIYQEILQANIKNIVVAVKSLINFYYPKLIINYRRTLKYNSTSGVTKKSNDKL